MDSRSKLKEACQRRPLTKTKRSQQNYTKYMDGMQEALNTNVQENVMPYWRDHNSLKGWCSMNYPCTVTNPTIKRRASQVELKKESKWNHSANFLWQNCSRTKRGPFRVPISA